jgi:hypothetical protein
MLADVSGTRGPYRILARSLSNTLAHLATRGSPAPYWRGNDIRCLAAGHVSGSEHFKKPADFEADLILVLVGSPRSDGDVMRQLLPGLVAHSRIGQAQNVGRMPRNQHLATMKPRFDPATPLAKR